MTKNGMFNQRLMPQLTKLLIHQVKKSLDTTASRKIQRPAINIYEFKNKPPFHMRHIY